MHGVQNRVIHLVDYLSQMPRVVVDGFPAGEVGLTGPTSTLNVASPTGGMTISCNGNTSDNGDYGTEIQRFTFHYHIDFPDYTAPTEFVTLCKNSGKAIKWFKDPVNDKWIPLEADCNLEYESPEDMDMDKVYNGNTNAQLF
jgi:hypothetical protein